MLMLIGVSAFACVAFAALLVMRVLNARREALRGRVDMLAAYGAGGRPADARLLRMQNYSTLPWLQRHLQGMARAERLADDLERAAIRLRVGEFLAFSLIAGALCGVIAYRFLPGGVIQLAGMLAALALGFLLPRRIVSTRIRRRRAQFDALLPEALDILSRSIRTGNGLLISIDTLVEQMPGVIGAEFGRMRRDVTAGISLEDALQELDGRMKSPDLHIVITALLVQREVGGNLTEILDNVSRTMRQRTTLRREMRVLAAQQRYGAWIIALIPPAFVLMMYVFSNDFITPLFQSSFGLVCIGIAVTLEILGALALKLVTSFEV